MHPKGVPTFFKKRGISYGIEYFFVVLLIEKLPGPASSIGRVFACCASNPSSNTGELPLPCGRQSRNLDFSKILFGKKRNWIRKTANFNSLDESRGSNVALINWLQDLRWSHNLCTTIITRQTNHAT